MFKKYIEKDSKKADYIIENNDDKKTNITKKAQNIFNLIIY
jgi:hypothetical protein